MFAGPDLPCFMANPNSDVPSPCLGDSRGSVRKQRNPNNYNSNAQYDYDNELNYNDFIFNILCSQCDNKPSYYYDCGGYDSGRI
jgi:hypothetical protein